jgi:hypothetical protein
MTYDQDSGAYRAGPPHDHSECVYIHLSVCIYTPFGSPYHSKYLICQLWHGVGVVHHMLLAETVLVPAVARGSAGGGSNL